MWRSQHDNSAWACSLLVGALLLQIIYSSFTRSNVEKCLRQMAHINRFTWPDSENINLDNTASSRFATHCRTSTTDVRMSARCRRDSCGGVAVRPTGHHHICKLECACFVRKMRSPRCCAIRCANATRFSECLWSWDHESMSTSNMKSKALQTCTLIWKNKLKYEICFYVMAADGVDLNVSMRDDAAPMESEWVSMFGNGVSRNNRSFNSDKTASQRALIQHLHGIESSMISDSLSCSWI